MIERLYAVIEQRKKDMPEGSYTTHLFNSGMSKIKKKTGEEAIELLLAEDHDEIVSEASDLIYHMLVLLAAADIKPEEIFKELESRE
ncbi:MAG TPA: phosphoribosyl-ATP diphosphatase [Spirochaeta sp.]|nr:phosphoribosyl-ATP diphosphatase [Spirochaeta sp.]